LKIRFCNVELNVTITANAKMKDIAYLQLAATFNMGRGAVTINREAKEQQLIMMTKSA
jgi:hypothetical protein